MDQIPGRSLLHEVNGPLMPAEDLARYVCGSVGEAMRPCKTTELLSNIQSQYFSSRVTRCPRFYRDSPDVLGFVLFGGLISPHPCPDFAHVLSAHPILLPGVTSRVSSKTTHSSSAGSSAPKGQVLLPNIKLLSSKTPPMLGPCTIPDDKRLELLNLQHWTEPN